MLIFLLLLTTFTPKEDSYVVWLVSKKRVMAAGPPACDGGRCVITLPNGEVTSLPASAIDQAKTQKYNEDLAAQRETLRKKAEAEAAAEAERRAQEEELRRTKVATLKPGRKLPKYDRSAAGTEKTPSEEETTQTAVGEPETITYKAEGPVYVSRSVTTTYSDHQRIEGVVVVAELETVPSLTAKLTLQFEKSAPAVMEQKLTGPFTKGQQVPLTFTTVITEKIKGLSWELSAPEPAAK